MINRLIFILIPILLLASCGTISGALNGTSSVLEGVASDTRSLGAIFK
jgi:hypothetical protein